MYLLLYAEVPIYLLRKYGNVRCAFCIIICTYLRFFQNKISNKSFFAIYGSFQHIYMPKYFFVMASKNLFPSFFMKQSLFFSSLDEKIYAKENNSSNGPNVLKNQAGSICSS